MFTLTSRLVSFDLNSHGTIDHASGALVANFDQTPPGLADAFAAFGRYMAKYAPFRFAPSANVGKPSTST